MIAWQAANPERRKNRQRARQGLPLAAFEALSRAQKGRCLACKEPATLVVDHCHASGNFRGLICGHCNSALGFARDSPKVLRALARYLETTRTIGGSLTTPP